MKILELLRARLEALNVSRSAAISDMDAVAELATVESRSELSADETVAFSAAEQIVRGIDTEIDALEARIGELTKIEERTALASVGAASRRPIVPGVASVPTVEETRGFTPIQLVDAVTRSIEERGIEDVGQARTLLKRHTKSDPAWARNLLVRSSEVYSDAWVKMMTGRAHDLTAEERTAMSSGSAANGGYLVPTHLDPSIILTSAASNNAVRRISRVVTLTREKTWNGVTSSGVTASWDGELAEVSDDSPTLGNPSIPTIQAQAFVQASFAAFEDVEGLAGDVLFMFADAKDRLEGIAHCTGNGTSQPKGIFTACDASTTVEVTSATAATLALADLTGLRSAVPVRHRGNASWLMHPNYADAIRALGTAVSASYSVDITGANTDTLLGRPVYETDDAPSTQTTTVKDNEIIVGDFSQYVIVDKPGSTAVEFIPNLFNTSNNLPDGRRGWFMHWRTGADATNVGAFRLLQDKTSA